MIEPPQGAEAQSRRASLEIQELRGNKTSTNLFSYVCFSVAQLQVYCRNCVA